MENFDEAALREVAPRARRGGRILALLRLFLILGIVGLFVYLTWIGGFLGVLAWLFTVIILIDTAVNVLFGFFEEEGSRRYGFIYWIGTLFLGVKGVQMVIKGGEIRRFRPTGPLADIFARLGAPGIVIVDNGVAAVFERSGRFTRVQGPGVAFTKRFERVAHTVDLRPQVRSCPIKQIMTRDGLSFDLKQLGVVFEVATDFNPQRGEYSFSEEAVLDLVYRGGVLYDKGEEMVWQDRVVYTVEYHLRNVAASHPLAELVRGDQASARQRFLKEVEEQARPHLRQFGVQLKGIDMGQIVVPEELRDVLTLPLKQIVDLGWAHTQRDTIIGISEGLKQALAKIEAGMPQDAGETRPHLLLSLTETLRQILEEALRLAKSYRALPEARPLLPGGEEAAESPSEG